MSVQEIDIASLGISRAMKRAKALHRDGLSLSEIERKLRSEADTLIAGAEGFITVAEGIHRINHNLITVEEV